MKEAALVISVYENCLQDAGQQTFSQARRVDLKKSQGFQGKEPACQCKREKQGCQHNGT